jgi:TDG/mug DNA glycosylase family protein
VSFTRDRLIAFRGRTVPDLLGPHVRLLIVGINPGLRAAAVQAPFGGGSNRFYPALFAAGITDRPVDARNGFLPADLEHLHDRGVGITSLVAAATARADELSPAQLVEGAAQLEARVESIAPRVVAMLGITAYRVAFAEPQAVVGRQPRSLGGAELWVVPNPSGLNAHATLASLAADYREVAIAAGIPVYDRPLLNDSASLPPR